MSNTPCRRIENTRGFLDWRLASGNTVEIYDIEVKNEWRKKGTGKHLVNQLMTEIPSSISMIWAITRAENFIAQRFYENMRFRVVGVLRNFYQDGVAAPHNCVDAIMYGRDLKEGSKA